MDEKLLYELVAKVNALVEIVEEIKEKERTKEKENINIKDQKEKESKKEKEKEFLRAEYLELLEMWSNLFPEKAQPHLSTVSYRNKFRTRMKNKEFREKWRDALKKAAENPALHSNRIASWFRFNFFLMNDDKWQMCLDGSYDFLIDKLTPEELAEHETKGETMDQLEFYQQFEG